MRDEPRSKSQLQKLEQGLVFKVYGLGFRVYGLGFRVYGLGLGGWGFRAWGLGYPFYMENTGKAGLKRDIRFESND